MSKHRNFIRAAGHAALALLNCCSRRSSFQPPMFLTIGPLVKPVAAAPDSPVTLAVSTSSSVLISGRMMQDDCGSPARRCLQLSVAQRQAGCTQRARAAMSKWFWVQGLVAATEGKVHGPRT